MIMRLTLLVCLALYLSFSAFADNATGIAPFVPGQILGSTTNDSASAGNVGEIISNTATAQSLTTGTPANVTSVALTAGDWQVCGEVRFIPAGTTTVSSVLAASHTVSATFPTDPDISYANITATLTTGSNQRLPVDCKRYSLASTTTIFLIAQAAFATSTMTADGSIYGRRMR